MDRFTLTINNLRGIRELRWSPSGVSLLIGANGAGKSTTLLALKFLRVALDRTLPQAGQLVLGSTHDLRHRDSEGPVEIGVQVGDLRWHVRLQTQNANLFGAESLYQGDKVVFEGDSSSTISFGADKLVSHDRLGLRTILDSQIPAPAVERISRFIRNIVIFHDPDLYALRQGSDTSQNKHLHSRGGNTLSMLRQWSQQRPDRHRYQFVLSGLKAAFPGLIEDLDFVEAGRTLVARVYRPGREAPEPLSTEANGVLAMMVHLCCLAAADDGGLVAIDEPENALHPFAIRVLARRAEALSRQKDLIVLFSTHSTVLLDHFNGAPEQVFVLQPNQSPGPVPVTQLRDPEWLQQFRLGELYANGEISSNDSLD